MSNIISNPEVAAAAALGLNRYASTSHALAARFREAVERRNLAPFRLGQFCFEVQLPAIAAINVSRHFAGQTSSWVGSEASEPLFSGFHRRGKEGALYHPDSVDFEDRAEMACAIGDELFNELTAAGVNPTEARQVQPLSTCTTLIASGTLVDFFELLRAVGPLEANAHPDARAFARDCWRAVGIECPLVSQAFVEAGL